VVHQDRLVTDFILQTLVKITGCYMIEYW